MVQVTRCKAWKWYPWERDTWQSVSHPQTPPLIPPCVLVALCSSDGAWLGTSTVWPVCTYLDLIRYFSTAQKPIKQWHSQQGYSSCIGSRKNLETSAVNTAESDLGVWDLLWMEMHLKAVSRDQGGPAAVAQEELSACRQCARRCARFGTENWPSQWE